MNSMKKTIFDPTLKQQLLARIDNLKPTTNRKWGKMNATQALRHIAMGYKMSLGEGQEPIQSGGMIKKKIFRFMILNMPIPKGKAPTFLTFNMVDLGINPTDFQAEIAHLKSYIEKTATSTSFAPENPMAGQFSRVDWGRLMYKHTDHHLKQFGV